MAAPIKDIKLPPNSINKILFNKHIDFINDYGKDENNFEYGITDYLRLSGMYWGLTALELMHAQPTQSKDDIVAYIQQCQDQESGGIGACIGHDPHILHTLSAVQVRTTLRFYLEADMRERVYSSKCFFRSRVLILKWDFCYN